MNGFPAELLVDLVHDGLVTIHDETVKASDRTIEVIRVRITEAGQSAMQGREP